MKAISLYMKEIKSSLSIFSIIFLFFLACKVLGFGIVANWSWLWVFSPYWIPIAVVVGVVLLAILIPMLSIILVKSVIGIVRLFTYRKRRKRERFFEDLSEKLRKEKDEFNHKCKEE